MATPSPNYSEYKLLVFSTARNYRSALVLEISLIILLLGLCQQSVSVAARYLIVVRSHIGVPRQCRGEMAVLAGCIERKTIVPWRQGHYTHSQGGACRSKH